MDNIYYTEDYDNIPDKGVVFYNDCDETVMELWKDGKVIASTYIDDFCDDMSQDVNDFREDKTLVYDMFIQFCYENGWVS